MPDDKPCRRCTFRGGNRYRRKRGYTRRRDAVRAMKMSRTSKGGHWTVYYCGRCDRWRVGHVRGTKTRST